MQVQAIRVDDIEIGERLRSLSTDAVARLAQSIKEIGLQQPITIRVVDEMMLEGRLTAGVPILVAGAHRLAAAKSLGWTHIDCVEVDDDALRAELWEIDENLMRSELSPAQQADHLARRKVIWETLSVQIAPKPTGGRPAGFASDTAARAGVNKTTVTRDIARATALGSDIRAVVGTSLDKGVELDALSKMTPDERAPLIRQAQAGMIVTARPLHEDDAVEKQVNALIGAWNRAGPDARQRFLDYIDTPVFDATRSGA
jgi:ParB/RepB/Spo0J family partition protein